MIRYRLPLFQSEVVTSDGRQVPRDSSGCLVPIDAAQEALLIKMFPTTEAESALKIARLSRSTDQTFTHGSVKTYVSWDAADFDTTGGVWSIATPTKFIIPGGCSYARISAQLRISDAPAGQNIVCHIEKNGLTTVPGMALQDAVRATSAGGLNTQATMEWMPVIAGDVFQIYSINVDSTNDYTISGSGRLWAFIELR